MIATATPWTTKPGTPGTYTRTYFDGGRGHAVTAEVTHDAREGRVWFKAWRIGAADRFGTSPRELIAHGALAATPHALAVAKARVSRIASRIARRVATAYYQAKLARAMDRVDAARAALDEVPLTEYKMLAARQDELVQLIAELDHLERSMMALAA